jgi:hypothetical protein
MNEHKTNHKPLGIDGKESPFGKAFLDCTEAIRIAEFEANLWGKKMPNTDLIINQYFNGEINE